MWMFDWVDHEMPCPNCGANVDGFQSKDGDCALAYLKPKDVYCYYSICPKCEAWIEIHNLMDGGTSTKCTLRNRKRGLDPGVRDEFKQAYENARKEEES